MAEEQVSLNLLVDKKKNRVLSAEAGKDFVDALLGFLTLPLGTIARLVGQDSNLKPVRVGSLSSLYQSVANLEEKRFTTEACKEMLLQPRNSMESLQNPKLNIDDSEPIKYFICQDWGCSCKESGSLYSTFKNTKCTCGQVMNREISLHQSLLSRKIHEGYVNELATFTLSDELNLTPSNLLSRIVLLKNLGMEDMDSIEEMTVNVSQKEVMDLLKCSILSKTPLTDLFLLKKEVQEDFESDDLFLFDFGNGKSQTQAEDSERMKVKVMLTKSKRKVLFAQAEEDFADFLLSFLTLPLGAVLNLLQGDSGLICLDNLFNSLADLHAGRHLRSDEIKRMLVKPLVAPQFKPQNQILPIDEATASNYSCYSDRSGRGKFLTEGQEYLSSYSHVYAPLTLWDPKSSSVNTSSPGGFVKGPSTYVVTDDLAVIPISSISVVSILNNYKIPLHDLEERVISIGLEEGFSILEASLVSSSALTAGLRLFL